MKNEKIEKINKEYFKDYTNVKNNEFNYAVLNTLNNTYVFFTDEEEMKELGRYLNKKGIYRVYYKVIDNETLERF